VRIPSAHRLHRYARCCLGLGAYFEAPGDGRRLPRIPARDLLWSLLLAKILRVASLHGTERLVHLAEASMGVASAFSDDALGYFLERLDAQRTRRALVELLRRAKRNKVFENVVRIGLALDGTGLDRTRRDPCGLCHAYLDPQGKLLGHGHQLVMASIVGAGIVLPFDIEPITPGENELSASKRLLPRTIRELGPRFLDYVVLDSLYAGAPFVRLAVEGLGLDVIVGLKSNMPDLLRNARARFHGQRPTVTFCEGGERIELWDAEDVRASDTLPWPTVRVLRSQRTLSDGKVVEAYCFTTFSSRAVGPRGLFRMRRSRWEIENQGFNDAKNHYGLDHIPHHEPNSLLLHALLTCLALCVERLYRLRHLHRGTHAALSAIELHDLLWLSLGARPSLDSS